MNEIQKPDRSQPFNQKTILPLLTGQLSPNTIRAYQADILQFFKVANIQELQAEMVQSVTLQDIIEFRDTLLARCKPATVARKLATLRTEFQYFVDSGIISTNPAKNSWVKSPKVPTDNLTGCLTQKEAEQLLLQPNRNTLVGKRDHAILSLMLNNGLRRSEVVNARLCDLKQEGSYYILSIIGKGSKYRIAKLKPQVWDALQEYLKIRQETQPEGRVFVSHSRGKCLWQKSEGQISGESIRLLIVKYAKRAGISKRIHPHLLRVVFTTSAIEGGAKIHQVQAALGHSDPKTTMRYFRHRDNLADNATDYVHFSE